MRIHGWVHGHHRWGSHPGLRLHWREACCKFDIPVFIPVIAITFMHGKNYSYNTLQVWQLIIISNQYMCMMYQQLAGEIYYSTSSCSQEMAILISTRLKCFCMLVDLTFQTFLWLYEGLVQSALHHWSSMDHACSCFRLTPLFTVIIFKDNGRFFRCFFNVWTDEGWLKGKHF